MPAGLAEPGHADARPGREIDAIADRLDAADDLVAGNDRQLRIRQFAVDHVQVGAADAAGLDPHADLAAPGSGRAAPPSPAARRPAAEPWRA